MRLFKSQLIIDHSYINGGAAQHMALIKTGDSMDGWILHLAEGCNVAK